MENEGPIPVLAVVTASGSNKMCFHIDLPKNGDKKKSLNYLLKDYMRNGRSIEVDKIALTKDGYFAEYQGITIGIQNVVESYFIS